MVLAPWPGVGIACLRSSRAGCSMAQPGSRPTPASLTAARSRQPSPGRPGMTVGRPLTAPRVVTLHRPTSPPRRPVAPKARLSSLRHQRVARQPSRSRHHHRRPVAHRRNRSHRRHRLPTAHRLNRSRRRHRRPIAHRRNRSHRRHHRQLTAHRRNRSRRRRHRQPTAHRRNRSHRRRHRRPTARHRRHRPRASRHRRRCRHRPLRPARLRRQSLSLHLNPRLSRQPNRRLRPAPALSPAAGRSSTVSLCPR